MSRVRTADRCADTHELEVGGQPTTFICTRGAGHPGVHSTGSITWPRRLAPPRSDRTPAPPRRPEESRPPA